MLLCMLIIFSFCSMQAMEVEQKTITIQSMMNCFEFLYEDSTTILDVKKNGTAWKTYR